MQYECLKCKKLFFARPYEKRKYCSQACHFADHTIVRRCPQCGKERAQQKAKPIKNFCSTECWGLYRRSRKTYVCAFCSKEIEGHPSKPRTYCSKKCMDEARTLPEAEFKARWYKRVQEYRKNHPNKTAKWKQNRRAREMGAEGSFTEEEWVDLKKKNKNRCAKCKEKKKLTIDHIVPLSRGGSNYIENIQPLCMPCNSKKSAKI